MTRLRRNTLYFLYFCKFLELFFLMGLSVYIIVVACDIMTWHDFGFGTELMILSTLMIPLIILVTLHLFYQNLLLNLRFSINLKSRTAGLICYKFVNYLFCHCFLEKCCRDKCKNRSTQVKWLFMIVLLGGTIWIVSEGKRLTENYRDGDDALR